MSKQEYDYRQGYDHGVASTLDQKRGARDAFYERQKREREAEEFSKRVEAANREREENERRLREQERKKRENVLAQQQKKLKEQRDKPEAIKDPAPENRDWSAGWAFFGFLISAAWAAGQAQSSGFIIIAGLIGAVVMGRFYGAIIGFSILAAIVAGFAGYI